MIELIQIPYSPFCIVTRRILEYSGVPFSITNVPNGDRSLVWKLSKERYYQVPLLKDGRNILFETDENSQVIAKYLDDKFKLGLFPSSHEGVQFIVWRYLEGEIEDLTFRLNDAHWEEVIPKEDRVRFIRHKERKFGRGCLQQWKENQKTLTQSLAEKLLPCEEMLMAHPFLLGDKPLFVDFDLFGMLGNFLYSGHYALPKQHTAIKKWHARMSSLKSLHPAREKLHS